MDPWQSVLLAFGGNAALLLLLGWLARSLGSQLLAKDVEKFKNDLAAASSNATEQLKHELAVAALEHNVKFSKLYDRRAEVVAEAYGLLVEVHWASQSFVSLIEWAGEAPKKEKYITARRKIDEFYRFFDKNRIYLPQALSDQLDQFLRGMRDEVIGFGVYASKEDDQISDTILERKSDAATYFDQEVPKAKAALETELRRIIGA